MKKSNTSTFVILIFEILKFEILDVLHLVVLNVYPNPEIQLHQRANIRTSKITSGVEYRMDEQFQNLLIFGILVVFQI